MLLQLIIDHPQVLGTIVRNTPVWVWGLLAGLTVLGLSQARDRVASLTRMAATPAAMTAFSLWGTVSAFSAAPQIGAVLAVWLLSALVLATLIATTRAPGTYDAASRTFSVPGSWVPMLLILGIFLTKYAVGVELAMQPQLARDSGFALGIAATYGAFSGIFAGRAFRLLRLAIRPRAALAA